MHFKDEYSRILKTHTNMVLIFLYESNTKNKIHFYVSTKRKHCLNKILYLNYKT